RTEITRQMDLIASTNRGMGDPESEKRQTVIRKQGELLQAQLDRWPRKSLSLRGLAPILRPWTRDGVGVTREDQHHGFLTEALRDLPVEDRFDVLFEMTFGVPADGEAKSMPAGAPVHQCVTVYEATQPDVHRQLYGAERTWDRGFFIHPDVPIWDSWVVLARDAKQCGRESLLLAAWEQAAGKSRWGIAGRALTEIICAKPSSGDQSSGESSEKGSAKWADSSTPIEAIRTIIDRLHRCRPPTPGPTKQPAKTSTTDRDDNKHPPLPFLRAVHSLAAVALQHDVDRDLLESLLDELRYHTTRGQDAYGMTELSRLMAAAGYGRPANATMGSPLEHFAVVEDSRFVPWYDINVHLRPLYRIDDDDWLYSAGGNATTLLMLKYPLQGDFTFSADIQTGGYGDSSVSAGGVNYHADGFPGSAKIHHLFSTKTFETFPVPSIVPTAVNVEAIRIKGHEVEAMCNGQVYVRDFYDPTFPFIGVTHQSSRPAKLRNFRIEGDASIPASVNLIRPPLRGWVKLLGASLPDRKLPKPPLVSAEGLKQMADPLRPSVSKTRWHVSEAGELVLTSNSVSAGVIGLLRPLLDGETITIEFWFEAGRSGVMPRLDDLVLEHGSEGWAVRWQRGLTSPASGSVLQPAVGEVVKRIGQGIALREGDWNTYEFVRRGNQVTLNVNGKRLLEETVIRNPNIMLSRANKQQARIRKVELRGDWPDTVPADLMQRVVEGK
ncbi:MAG: DUF1583 domain-containing protein, partial [Planctomycetota bacterium]